MVVRIGAHSESAVESAHQSPSTPACRKSVGEAIGLPATTLVLTITELKSFPQLQHMGMPSLAEQVPAATG